MDVIPASPDLKEFNEPFRSRLRQISSLVSSRRSTDVMNDKLFKDIPIEISLESLLDTFIALVMDYDKFASKVQTLRVNTQDFEVVKTLATGAVCLVIGKSDKQVYAMKVLKKTDLLTRREAAFFMEERNALVFARESTWITTLYAAFQDEEHLYLVMEYASGGSLRSLMNNREVPMNENEARFYIAELILALEELHGLQYIHRDVKPENCLIGSSGHLKLADFGSCIRMGDSNKVTSHETVGTPDYISPEILRALEGKVNYGKEVDMWSVGIILYELLFDEVPFYSESLMETYGKIMDHEKNFSFPDDIQISPEAEDLIKRLVCKQDIRLGLNGIDEIKSHPWFKGFDWKKAPGLVQMTPATLTMKRTNLKKSYEKNLPKTKEFAGQNLPFIGYSYVQNALASISWPFDEQNSAPTGTTVKIQSSSLNSSDKAVIRKHEETIALLEASRAKDLQYRDELQGLLTRLERDRNKLESDVRQHQTNYADSIREREELESRLNSLRRRLDAESQTSKARIQSLQEERDAAFSELSALKVELKHTKESESGRQEREKLKEEERDEMQKMIDRLNARVAEGRSLGDEANLKMEDAKRRLEREIRRREELEEEYQQLLQKNDGLEIDLKASKKSWSNEVSKNDRLSTANVELERLKTMLQVDLLAAKRKIESLQEEKVMLENTINDKQKDSGDTLNDISDLTSQLESLTIQRARDTESISTLQKEKASVEIEWRKTDELFEKEKEVSSDFQARLVESEEKLKHATDRIAFLEESKSKMTATHSAIEKEFVETKTLLLNQIQNLREVEIRLQTSERERAALVSEVSETKSLLAKEINGRKDLIQKISELERSLSDERRQRQTTESEQTHFEASISELQAEVDIILARNAAIKEETSKALSEKGAAISALREEHMALLLKSETENRLRSQLESENASLSKTLAGLKQRISDDARQISILEKNIESLEAELREASTHRSLEAARSITLQDRIDELESSRQNLQEQLGDVRNRFPRSLDSLKPDNKSVNSESNSEKARLKIRNVFFRSQQQKRIRRRPCKELMKLRKTLKKDQEKRRSRHISNDSNNSFRSNLTRLSDPVINIDFDFSGGLRGFLKVPKGGKVKKGWRIRYAVVREYKLYMFDKDKDYELSDSAVIADLRADLFLVRTVNQNELIHASAKDIDCIFKIQFTQSDANGGGSSTNISTSELTRRILKLKGDIQHEEKIQIAAERILNVTTDSQRPNVLSQLEVSGKRITKMNPIYNRSWIISAQDLIHMMKHYGHSSFTCSHLYKANLEEISAEVFEEEVQFCKKELEGQLESELRKYNNLLKLVGPANGATSPTRGQIKGAVPIQPNFKEIETEIQSTESQLHKIREDLAVLGSEITEVSLLVRRLCDRNTNGHAFKVRQFQKPTDCAHCHEALWGHRSLECSNCKYFMAENPTDRLRWIAGLEFFRKEAERVSGSTGTHLPGPTLGSLGRTPSGLGLNITPTIRRECRWGRGGEKYGWKGRSK
ncbi:hypothetical protein BC829DRAFT_418437 [Chytridium lagenaria]|nr:hypothetical protein BC829DRAFT_418437 [Chytridium lagenaria]